MGNSESISYFKKGHYNRNNHQQKYSSQPDINNIIKGEGKKSTKKGISKKNSDITGSLNSCFNLNNTIEVPFEPVKPKRIKGTITNNNSKNNSKNNSSNYLNRSKSRSLSPNALRNCNNYNNNNNNKNNNNINNNNNNNNKNKVNNKTNNTLNSRYKMNAPPQVPLPKTLNSNIPVPKQVLLKPKTNPIYEDYIISKQVLGLGISGKVLQCIHKETKVRYALKVKNKRIKQQKLRKNV
jgi:hypothetical protein